ncbi:hypothetical protein PHYBOEH_011976 [Phytophthora boehmeriae]|uniref:Voltage-dependent L-type calcium channel IQ-associated domain-containing protein n=1 Tax=Phytophthora boehmeriae TaxID=109152 RepID=A0A8T1X1U4_9STRA|nr:hypothetical protein PHYBOEH_011976 [Phytophthora boehmeriae]
MYYENFVATWSTFDPDATGTIQWHLLPKLIQELDEPLGYGKIKGVPAKEIAAFIDSLDVAMFNGNQIFFHDVARKLGKSVLDAVSESTVPELPNTIAATQKWRVLMKGGKFRTVERYHLKHLNASVLLHDAVRSLIFREELRAQVQKFTDLTSIYLSARPSPKGDGLRSRRGSIAKSSIEGSQQEL